MLDNEYHTNQVSISMFSGHARDALFFYGVTSSSPTGESIGVLKQLKQLELEFSAKEIVKNLIVNSTFVSGSSTDSDLRSHSRFFCCLRQEPILQWDWTVQGFKVLGGYVDVLFVNDRAYEKEFFHQWYQQEVDNGNTDPFREPMHFVFTRSEMEVAVKAELKYVAKALSISIAHVLYWLKQAGVIELINPRVITLINRLAIIDESHEFRPRRRLMPLTNMADNSEISLVVILFFITLADLLQEMQEQGHTSSFKTPTEAALSPRYRGYFSDNSRPYQNPRLEGSASDDPAEVFRQMR